ncbi:hypothetical protein DACRYDRAFT_119713 [Dacryopinax primogenitus]|uniref:Uncharacterized protein n=1 Tax=Dacryopinax primogenitus (strain DJM 731) TaxID=1858805 RepID=M5FUG8_DACPD|nr:uncharacterized protein DACRYDRAFT_119713 [Dacryopinax primogenitus]EJT96886.1 hypothetical protein DACRYDRAFT_119713 [Dacryopinax primogenitus]
MEEESSNRHKFRSQASLLKSTHVPILPSIEDTTTIDDASSSFHESLASWRELNLTLSFTEFADEIDPLTKSMNLLLHNWQQVIGIWINAFKKAELDALQALSDLLSKLIYDLRATLVPVYQQLLDQLLSRLNNIIPQQALQALLSSLSSLFKYILVPSSEHSLVSETWIKIASSFREGGDIGRLIAEAWGKTIRRLQSSQREKLVESMLAEEGGEFCVAVSLVEGMKSPNHGHPPSAPTVLRSIMSYVASHYHSDILLLTLKRVLTSLLHHTTQAHFGPLMDALLDAQGLFEGDAVQEWISVIRVPITVRKGARMQETHLKRIIPILSTLPISPGLVHLCTASLIASNLPIWASEGKRMLTTLWEKDDATFAVLVSQALVEAQWKGWITFGQPLVLLHHKTILEKQPMLALRLFGELTRQGMLQDVAGVTGGRGLLETLSTWTSDRLARYQSPTRDDICDLSNILIVLPFLPSRFDIASLIQKLMSTEAAREEWEQTPANQSWALSECLKYAVTSEQVDAIAAYVPTILKKWNWNIQVMEAIASAVTASKKALHPRPDKSDLQFGLHSQSHGMRTAVLQILCSGAADISKEDLDAYKQCLNAEEVPLSMEKIRERVMKTEHVNSLAAVDWLVAQLKINLRPLWHPASQTLAKIIQSHPDEAWEHLFRQLETSSLRPEELVEPDPQWSASASDDPVDTEDERTFRDPSLAKLDRLIADMSKPGHTHELESLRKAQLDPKRLDVANFEGQLLKTLALMPNLAEKNNRTLITLLFRVIGHDADDVAISSTRAIPRRIRSRLANWLNLLSKFSNPRALYRGSTLQQLYLGCLCTPESSLQRLAIDCLLTDSSSPLKSYSEKLRLLLDGTKFRDELSSLNLQDLPDETRAEVVPILMHLLYGVMIRRTSKGRARRRAILASLATCTSDELRTLVLLMLDPFQGAFVQSIPEVFRFSDVEVSATGTQQVGYLRLLGDVLTYLAPALQPYWPALLSTTLEILRTAQQKIDLTAQSRDLADENAEAESDAGSESSTHGDPTRSYYTSRQLGLKRVADFCKRCPNLDLRPYLPEMFRTLISPRLLRLQVENSQAPSALMGLFYTWSEKPDWCMFLAEYNALVIPRIAELLNAVNVKSTVTSQVLDIFDHILDSAASNAPVAAAVLSPNVQSILASLSNSLSSCGQKPPNDIVKREINLLSKLAPHVIDPTHAEQLVVALKPVLHHTGKPVHERVVSDALQIYASVSKLVPQLQDPFSAFFVDTYEQLGNLFQSVRERQARLSLVSAFRSLVDSHPKYALIGELVGSLNAFLINRPEEPDFDRRLAAFNIINETQYLIMGHLQWEPILWNAIYFVQDTEELSIRSNAAFVIRRFIERMKEQPIPEFQLVFTRLIYPGLRKALASKSDLVKSEVLSLFAVAAEGCDFTVTLRELRTLLAGGDEEASVLANLFHIQVHRRTRALRRLADHVRAGDLGSGVLTDVFIPLINHYLIDGSADHQILNESITCLGVIATRLPWRSYYALVQQYLRLGRRKTVGEKLYIRALIVILEKFSFPLNDPIVADGEEDLADIEQDDIGMDTEEVMEPSTSLKVAEVALETQSPQAKHIIEVVTTRLLPSLLSYMNDRTATEDEIRVPIAYGIICIALKLPVDDRDPQITRLLTTLSQVLRSRSHDTRQLARETLFKIAMVLGPDYLSKIVQSLREALTRGPQLHVLAVSVHGLLVHVTQPTLASPFTSMDSSAAGIAHVASEVIFGQSGKDVMNEGFKTTFREVRSSSSKGLETFQIISRYVTVGHVRDVLAPLRAILQSTDTQKTVHLVNDVLHRIATGLNSNQHLSAEDVLSLCHTLITQRIKLADESTPKAANGKHIASDFAVQMNRKMAEPTVVQADNLQKFVAFGLDLLLTAFRRNRFDLKDEGIVIRLEPMVPLIGEALYADDAQVAIASIKASAAILKCPLRSAEKSLGVFVKRLLNLVRRSGSLDAQVAQTALKSLATILRDCGKAKIVESDLKYLLELIGPELEEPERQSTAFTLLRSVIARQFVAPEIYDLMDQVFDALVTNQSAQVREACRGIALQFLLDYPQGKGRLRKHMAFLATNLSYEFESGRLSVMELLGAVLEKFQPDLLRDYVDMIFAALVMDLANDDSANCREMGAALIKKLFGRIERQQQQTVFTRVHLWINQVDQPELPAVAAQVYGLLMDSSSPALEKASVVVLQDLIDVIVRSEKDFKLMEQDEGDMQVDLDWRAAYHALASLAKLCQLYPALASSTAIPLELVVSLFLFPHGWVRLAAARLALLVLSATTQNEKNLQTLGRDRLPLLVDVARLSTLQLRSDNLNADHSLQIVKNLLFVGKCFGTISVLPKPVPEDIPASGEDDDEDEADEEEANEDDSTASILANPLAWLFTRLSFQLRRAHTSRTRTSSISASLSSSSWSQHPLAVLRWLAGMSAHLEPEVLKGFLPHILGPLYRIMEDDNIRDKEMDELKTLGRDLQDLLQQKVGTTVFANSYNAVRQRVGEVRRERKEKRVVREMTAPEAAARDRQRRNTMKERGKKRKAAMHAEARGRLPGKRRRVN